MMKRFLGLTVLIFGLSIPAHAQAKGGSAVAESDGVAPGLWAARRVGEREVSAVGTSGVTNFNTLPVIPPARSGFNCGKRLGEEL